MMLQQTYNFIRDTERCIIIHDWQENTAYNSYKHDRAPCSYGLLWDVTLIPSPVGIHFEQFKTSVFVTIGSREYISI